MFLKTPSLKNPLYLEHLQLLHRSWSMIRLERMRRPLPLEPHRHLLNLMRRFPFLRNHKWIRAYTNFLKLCYKSKHLFHHPDIFDVHFTSPSCWNRADFIKTFNRRILPARPKYWFFEILHIFNCIFISLLTGEKLWDWRFFMWIWSDRKSAQYQSNKVNRPKIASDISL